MAEIIRAQVPEVYVVKGFLCFQIYAVQPAQGRAASEHSHKFRLAGLVLQETDPATASRRAAFDQRAKPSGCGAEFALTYFDECLIGAWPKSKTWAQLFERTETCVRLKESELSEKPSMPQAFFGDAVKDLELP